MRRPLMSQELLALAGWGSRTAYERGTSGWKLYINIGLSPRVAAPELSGAPVGLCKALVPEHSFLYLCLSHTSWI